jgi:hypothetical protein
MAFFNGEVIKLSMNFPSIGGLKEFSVQGGSDTEVTNLKGVRDSGTADDVSSKGELNVMQTRVAPTVSINLLTDPSKGDMEYIQDCIKANELGAIVIETVTGWKYTGDAKVSEDVTQTINSGAMPITLRFEGEIVPVAP